MEEIKSKLSKILKLSGWSITILLVFIAGIIGGYKLNENFRPAIEKIASVVNKENKKPAGVDFNLFWDIWKKVEEKYVNKSKIDPEKMVYGAISGMVKSVGDPYTVFMDPQDAKLFQEDVSGSFSGIGAEIGIKKEILTVIAPLKDTPAEKAGLRAGDRILKINDMMTNDLTIEKAVSLIRGPKDTEVSLTISREGLDKVKVLKIIRNTIMIPSFKWEIKEKNIAYLKLYQFSSTLPAEFSKAVQEILNSSAKKIVLDLRNNPGGYLDVAQDIGSWFIPKGEVVAIEDFGDGRQIKYKSDGYVGLESFPLVVLVNEGSASASEILAGALSELRQAKLIGKKTFGKGSVQELEELQNGTSLKITIAKWLTPKGFSVSEQGLEPDVKVEFNEEDYLKNRDPQLDKALELIKNL